MDLFLSQAHAGSDLLGSYKTRLSSLVCRRRRELGVGEPTVTDFSRTVSGAASPLFLVNPGAPSDRERMVYASSLPDSFVAQYRDAVLSFEAPSWCTFNDPSLHEHIFRRLERAGMANRKKFINNPTRAAGEMCAFRYSGGSTPQNLIFPVGATDLNWLVVLRSAARLGTVAASTRDAGEQMPDLVSLRNTQQALRRLRIWRALNWVSEASRNTGLIRYEPFSVGCALYEHEVQKMQLKGKYERSMLYLGDHYSRESVLLSDIARGGLASDFWTVVEAVVKYKRSNEEAIESDRVSAAVEAADEASADWTDIIYNNRAVNEHGDQTKVSKTLEAAIIDFPRVGEARRAHLLDFVKVCLTPEQREVLYKALGERRFNSSLLTGLADSILANMARSGVWVMLHSLLKQINFTILHLIGYDAHRQLIFKIFLPALIALFLAQGGIGDSFLHGVFNLEVLKSRVSAASIESMLSRDTSATVSVDGPISSTPASSTTIAARNYSEYDIATLYGKLSDCTCIPLSINVSIPLHSAVMSMNKVDLVMKHTIDVGLAKQRLAADNRAARRLEHRRKVHRRVRRKREEDLLATQMSLEEDGDIEVGIEEDKEEEEEDKDEEEEGFHRGDRENDREEDQQDADHRDRPSVAKRSRRGDRRRDPVPDIPVPLKRDKYRENIAGLAIETIHNDDRRVNVESIQKLLTARFTKNRTRRHKQSQDVSVGVDSKPCYTDIEMAEAFIKYTMNLFDGVFGMKRGSILNSVHCNMRTNDGTYSMEHGNCACPNYGKHEPDCCIIEASQREALCAESVKAAQTVDAGDPKQVAARFRELVMDPPSLTALDDALAVERVLQNEQLLSSLVSNPVFNAVLGAEKGDLGRYVVLSNVVKFMNVLIACLADGDLPLLAETRCGVKGLLQRGQVTNTRRHPNSSTTVPSAQASSFRYTDAGYCSESGIRELLLPHCISRLKSIALEKGRGGRSAIRRQSCDHLFCRLLKFLFFSIDASMAVETFIDPASRATLFHLDDVCRDRKKHKTIHWQRTLIDPVQKGSEEWVKPGEYTPTRRDTLEDASPLDFYRTLKEAILVEGVIPIPKSPLGGNDISSITSPDDLLKESVDCSCEAHRPVLFSSTAILTLGQTTPERDGEDVDVDLTEEDVEQYQEEDQRRTVNEDRNTDGDIVLLEDEELNQDRERVEDQGSVPFSVSNSDEINDVLGHLVTQFNYFREFEEEPQASTSSAPVLFSQENEYDSLWEMLDQ